MKRESAKSVQILKTLKEEILTGRYVKVQTFPSEVALSRRFGVSRSMMTFVVSELEKQGLVTRSQGRPTFVTKQGARRKIGLILPGVAVSDFFRPMVTELFRLVRENGYELDFSEVWSSSHDERVAQVRELAASLIGKKVAGVIYEPLAGEGNVEINDEILSMFDRSGIPVVLIDSDILPFPDLGRYDFIGVDDLSAGACIARHLVSAGAKKIHFLQPLETTLIYQKRIVGARTYLREFSRNCKTETLTAAPADFAALTRHLKRFGRPDAFVCPNDAIAAVFLKTLGKARLKVPQDVLVTGFADLLVASLTTPTLTTVRQPIKDVGRVAFLRLLDRIADPALPVCSIALHAKLVVRESTVRTRVGRNG